MAMKLYLDTILWITVKIFHQQENTAARKTSKQTNKETYLPTNQPAKQTPQLTNWKPLFTVVADVDTGTNAVGHCRWKNIISPSGFAQRGRNWAFSWYLIPVLLLWHWNTEQPVTPDLSDIHQVECAGVLHVCGQEKVTERHHVWFKGEFLQCTPAQNFGGSIKENSYELARELSSSIGDRRYL